MKSTHKILLSSLLLIGVHFCLAGCATDAYVETGVYYGPRYHRPWFHDDPWIDGRRRGYYERDHYRGGGDVYINPPGLPPPPRLRLP